MHTHVNFMHMNKIETMYGRSRINVKVEPHSIFMFMCGHTYIHCLYFIHVRKFYKKLCDSGSKPFKSGWPCELPPKCAGCLKGNISPRLTLRGGGTYEQTSDICMYYVQMILSEPKFTGCIDKQIFLSIVLRCSRFTW